MLAAGVPTIDVVALGVALHLVVLAATGQARVVAAVVAAVVMAADAVEL